MIAGVAAAVLALWIYLLAGRGGFWRARDDDAEPDAAPAVAPEGERGTRASVVAVIPARDEAALIAECVGALLRQDYHGRFALIVVDDHSRDGTAAVARAAAAAAHASERLTVLSPPPLPPGWTGKLWAIRHGIAFAEALPEPPQYLLLTDADIRHAEDTLSSLVDRAVAGDRVLTSLMARLRCVSVAERALIPAFVFFFQMLYPFAWVRSGRRSTAAAAGGCMLVQRRALAAAGGVDAIRGELIDDCALARLLKPNGAIWLGLTRRVDSLRASATVSDIGSMVTRSAYAQLRFRPLLLAAVVAAMSATFLAPPLLALFGGGAAQAMGAAAWALMALAYRPILRFYGVSPAWSLALPAIAAAYLVFTLDSAWQHRRGRGGVWKGRIHRAATDDR